MPPIAPCRKNERLGRYTCQVLGAVPERTCDRMVVLSSIGVASLSVFSGHAAQPAYQVALRRPSVILRSPPAGAVQTDSAAHRSSAARARSTRSPSHGCCIVVVTHAVSRGE